MMQDTKYALITGASGDIGREIALSLAKQGFHLYLHYYRNDAAIQLLQEALRHFDVDVIPIQADFTNSEAITTLQEAIFQVDVFVHAAGTSYYGLFQDMSELEMKQLWDIHVHVPMQLLQSLLPKLQRSTAGRIIFISSIWGEVGAAMEVAYSAVKGAQIAFCKALAQEIALSGTTVNVVSPGMVDTKMNQLFSEEEKSALLTEIPLSRFAKPEEVGEAVAFLASDGARYMTGQTLRLNGGWFMR
ncbi:SDR family oxidoreductase [Listeria booriae]|uniref:elongation factor P 5-aminopentanone reductase n=1 Tax=Listeria booriae TaxID=1552123 RepID=UPI0016290DED|nr:SDR family oxidoreductase [Listeria booriae]MBC2368094.1 SDR family oxidoreductase [Listeria booriae]